MKDDKGLPCDRYHAEIPFLLIGRVSGKYDIVTHHIPNENFLPEMRLWRIREPSALPSCIALSYRPTSAYQAPVWQTPSAGEYRYSLYTYIRILSLSLSPSASIQLTGRTLFLYLLRYREFRSVELPSATF